MRSIETQNQNDSLIGGSHDTAVAMAIDRSTETSKRTSATNLGDDRGESQPDIVGKLLADRYLVTKKVGQGGMGVVYEATHTLINKRVAIKVLLEKYAQREALVARLKKEAQLASSVRNEHIIDIADIGTTDDGRTFVVMEFLEGESLAECLHRESRLPEQRVLRICSQAASALAAAHEKGVVHRDIKPENLFLLKQKDLDFVKIVDFGISKSLRASGEEEEAQRLTQTGMVLGTPLYMSPEQARGDDELDHRVDIYALGVIMYEAGTGRAPFLGNNYLSVISQVLNEDPKPLRELRPEISEEFEAIVLRAMEKDRKERYKDATEMLNDITALLDDPSRSTERAKITGPRKKLAAKGPFGLRLVVWIAAICVILAAIVATVVMMMGTSKKPTDTMGSGSAAAVLPVTIDAAPPIDAGPVDAAAETIEVKFETTPPGATVEVDGFTKCEKTPCKFEIAIDGEVEGIVHLDGYNDKGFKLNPVLVKKNPLLAITLTKPKGGAAPVIIKTVEKKVPVTPPGGDKKPEDHTNGNPDLSSPFNQPPPTTTPPKK